MDFKAWLSWGLAFSLAVEMPVFATQSDSFATSVRALQAAVAIGTAPEAATRDFLKSLKEHGVRTADLLKFADQELSPSEFRKFQANLDVRLKGIDPATLSASEWSEIAQDALAQSTSRGLAWSTCNTKIAASVALLATAVVFWVLGYTKNQAYFAVEDRMVPYQDQHAREREAIQLKYDTLILAADSTEQIALYKEQLALELKLSDDAHSNSPEMRALWDEWHRERNMEYVYWDAIALPATIGGLVLLGTSAENCD